MCGIAGVLAYPGTVDPSQLPQIVDTMAARLTHRGPDDHGCWSDPEGGVALGHRRLSILDISPTGQQPMCSAGGRYVMVFNGEIYNHQEMRFELSAQGKSPAWRGTSDTESLLAAIEAWGLEATVSKLRGMFALALWDRSTRRLFLARDPIGEKPLYYGRVGQLFAFASELKALFKLPNFRAEIDGDALTAYLRFGFVPAPLSIFEGIRKLPPGSLLEVDANCSPTTHPYWRLADVITQAERYQDYAVAQEELEVVLSNSIRQQMVADVPLGAFLSGGIDSSLVAVLMQAHSRQPVSTFTIGFREPGFNEADHAKAVAVHLHTDHTEFYVTAQDALAVVPKLPMIWDEPFADTSQIPTYLVATLARKHVTVALSGDGGDEFFGGYNRYIFGPKIWARSQKVPSPLRSALCKAAAGISPDTWDSAIGALRCSSTGVPRETQVGDKLHKVAYALAGARMPLDFYRGLTSSCPCPERFLAAGRRQPSYQTGPGPFPALNPERFEFPELMMYEDALCYLPDDVMVKVDRACMAVSLESRAPFLSRDVMELAWRIPPSMKFRNGRGKAILRDILKKHLPSDLVDYPKSGFDVPIRSWLQGPLREWAGELLSENQVRRLGLLDHESVHRMWTEHIAGQRNHQQALWNVIMLQAWAIENT
jgi:asparagine synthase (glutamine-hydrolysing)